MTEPARAEHITPTRGSTAWAEEMAACAEEPLYDEDTTDQDAIEAIVNHDMRTNFGPQHAHLKLQMAKIMQKKNPVGASTHGESGC